MEGIDRYIGLRRLGVLMALDTAGSMIEGAILVLYVAASDRAWLSEDALYAVDLYGTWSLGAFRTLVWVLTLVLLSRLTDLCRAFGNARVWYHLRILIFIATHLVSGLIQYGLRDDPAVDLPLVSGTLVFDFGTLFLAETVVLSMGIRAVLSAGAELLDTFGREDQAERDRRCGRRLIRLSAALVVLALSAVILLLGAVLMEKGILFRTADPEGGVSALLMIAGTAALLLCFPAGLGVTALRSCAAVRMDQTYRAIEELTG